MAFHCAVEVDLPIFINEIQRHPVWVSAFKNRKMQLLSSAVRALGRNNVREEDLEMIKWSLSSVPMKEFLEDIPLCPEWVRDLFLELKAF